MMKDRYRSMMEQAVLSEQTKADLLEKLEQKRPARKGTRVLRAALIVACACVVLVGGAFAVTEYVNSVDVEIDKGHTFTSDSGEEFVHDGYKTASEGIQNFPMDRFSEEIRQLDGAITEEMKTLGAVRYYFESWNEMEKFLGVDVMNNAVLESVPKKYQYDRVLDKTAHCALLLTPRGDKGEIEWITSVAYFVVDSGTRTDGTEYEVTVTLMAEMYTEHYTGTGMNGVYYYEGTNFEIIEYPLPGGEVVEIVWVDTNPEDYADLSTKITDRYDVHFAMNGVNYFLNCAASDEEKTETLEILKNILDSFQ